MFTSVVALPQAAPQSGGAGHAQSSVVYLPGKVRPIVEIMEQLDQLKIIFSDLKLGFCDMKMSQNETRLDLSDLRGKFNEHLTKNGCGKKPKKIKDYACRAPFSLL
jgi:hypothetical protein